MTISFIMPTLDGLRASEEYVSAAILSLADKGTDADFLATLLQHAHNLLAYSSDEAHVNAGIAALCHVAEVRSTDPMVRQLLIDCISASRNFLYLDMLGNTSSKHTVTPELGNFDYFKREFYRAQSGSLLTKPQRDILETYRKTRRLILSAPTSFGKTKLLQEIILAQKYRRIAIVMPTIALIGETVRKLRRDSRFDDYVIVNSDSMPPGNERFIFVLTPERMDLLLDSNPDLHFEFFAMDEIYKIQGDQRSPIFANVLYRLTVSKADFYLIGPYFRRFSENFLRWSSSVFNRYSIEIVQKTEININDYAVGQLIEIDGTEVKKAKTVDTTLKHIVRALKEQQLIYNGTRQGAESVAKKIAAFSDETLFPGALIEYIAAHISDEWSLITCLRRGVAFHHGSMPRYIQTELVDYFNRGQIRTLVCTTTLIEGVNTTAKNVIVLSNTKGELELSGFDYKNIKGRAGRFVHHFVGRVISFCDMNEQELDVISFRYLDEEKLGSEEVLSISPDHLSLGARDERLRIVRLLESKAVPVDLIRANKYIPVERQLRLIDFLRNETHVLFSLVSRGMSPTLETLDQILDLVREFLFNKQDFEESSFSFGQLKRLIKFYVYKQPSIKQLIAEQDAKMVDTRIRRTFYFLSHYCEFSLPRYLSCFQNLFNFVRSEWGLNAELNLNYVILVLQYGFSEPHEIALKEAGLPDQLIAKLSPELKECRSIEEIRYRFQIDPGITSGLSEFEQELFRKTL